MLRKGMLFTIGGGAGGLVSSIVTQLLGSSSAFSSWVYSGALDAACIGVALVYLQNYYQTNSWENSNKLLGSLGLGLFIGAIGGFVAMLMMPLLGSGDFGRFIGWGVSGAAAGFVASLRIPNLKRKVAMAAGGIGAILGCFIMYLGLSYTLGVVITGAAIGLMVALSEVLFRKMSLDIIINPPQTSGLNLTKPHRFNLTLGEKPLTVGYSSVMDIQLKPTTGTTIKHAGDIYIEGGQVFFNDIEKNDKSEVIQGARFNYREASISLNVVHS
ncbi:MAG: hypothetical protein KAH22_09500 [Thiotrichaceae bacterium]|nr:hypothetical protein [Thiotrichaceae bacterium]